MNPADVYPHSSRGGGYSTSSGRTERWRTAKLQRAYPPLRFEGDTGDAPPSTGPTVWQRGQMLNFGMDPVQYPATRRYNPIRAVREPPLQSNQLNAPANQPGSQLNAPITETNPTNQHPIKAHHPNHKNHSSDNNQHASLQSFPILPILVQHTPCNTPKPSTSPIRTGFQSSSGACYSRYS